MANKFNKAELVLDETEVDPDVLTETRKFVMKLAKKRNIDETPAAIGEAAESLATAILAKASAVSFGRAARTCLCPRFHRRRRRRGGKSKS